MQIKLKKITLLTFYFLSSYIGTAQSIELKGRIIEKEKHKPLNFATIEIKSLAVGTYTDIDGYFTITLPEKNQKDTISFYALGYDRKNISINKFVNSGTNTVELKQKYYNIKEVSVKPKKQK